MAFSIISLMAELSEELKDIKDELRELRLLYKQLAEKVILVVKPAKKEKEAIEQKDEIVSEEVLMKSLE